MEQSLSIPPRALTTTPGSTPSRAAQTHNARRATLTQKACFEACTAVSPLTSADFVDSRGSSEPNKGLMTNSGSALGSSRAERTQHLSFIYISGAVCLVHASLGLPRATLLLLRSFCSVILRSKGFRHWQIQHVSARPGPATWDGHHCKTIRGTYEAGGRRHLRTYRLLLTWALQASM